MSDSPAASPRPAASKWEDLIDVFLSPAELFRRRSDGKFGHALLILVVLSALIFLGTRGAMQPIFDAEFQRGMAARPDLTPERIESARALTRSLAPVLVLVGLPIGVLVLGLVVWLASRVIGARLNYPQSAMIATFAFFPRLLEGIVGAIQALLMDESRLNSRFSVSLGVGRFLDPETTGPMLLGVLGRIDLFTLWGTVLVAVGLRQMGRVTPQQAAAGAALVWLIGALPALLQGLQAG